MLKDFNFLSAIFKNKHLTEAIERNGEDLCFDELQIIISSLTEDKTYLRANICFVKERSIVKNVNVLYEYDSGLKHVDEGIFKEYDNSEWRIENVRSWSVKKKKKVANKNEVSA